MIKLKELLNQSLIISYFCSNHCKQQYNSEGQFLSTQSRATVGVYCSPFRPPSCMATWGCVASLLSPSLLRPLRPACSRMWSTGEAEIKHVAQIYNSSHNGRHDHHLLSVYLQFPLLLPWGSLAPFSPCHGPRSTAMFPLIENPPWRVSLE